MLFPPIDPNERFRERRAAARRRKRLRRSAAVGAVPRRRSRRSASVRVSSGRSDGQPTVADLATLAASPTAGPRTLPIELRGVHVTMALASLPGKLDEYLDLERDGLTALELDVKDENGEIGFAPGLGSPGRDRRARRATTTPRATSRGESHARGIYLIGRIVVFEDPVLSRATAGSRDPSVGRLGLEGRGGPRVDEPVRQARLEVQRRHRRCGGAGGLRRDHVRLRPLPVRRGRRSRRLPRTAARSASARRSRPSCATRIARLDSLRRSHLGRRVRPVGGARPRHRPAPEAHGAAPRHRVRDDLSVAVRPGRARAPGSEHGARRDRFACAPALRARASRHATRSSCRGCRTSASPFRTASTRSGRRSTLRGCPARRGTCSGTPRACTRTARSRLRSSSRRESLAAPAVGLADVANAVVKPVVAVRPELDARGDEAIAAPERREGDVASGESLLRLGDAGVELVTPAESAATAVTPTPRSGCLAAETRQYAVDSSSVVCSTAPSIRTCRPSSHQWRTAAARGLRSQLVPLARRPVREERDPAVVEPSQEHDSRGRPSVGIGCRERHRIRLRTDSRRRRRATLSSCCRCGSSARSSLVHADEQDAYRPVGHGTAAARGGDPRDRDPDGDPRPAQPRDPRARAARCRASAHRPRADRRRSRPRIDDHRRRRQHVRRLRRRRRRGERRAQPSRASSRRSPSRPSASCTRTTRWFRTRATSSSPSGSARSSPISGETRGAFFNAGAEAVENAVKLARLYTKRQGVIAFEGAFHGRTWMALTMTSKTHPYKKGLGPFAPEVYRAPYPNAYRGPDAESALAALERHVHDARLARPHRGDRLRAAAGRGRLHPGARRSSSRVCARICDEHGIVLVADEVQTGFGRTGRMFAMEHFDVEPDLIDRRQVDRRRPAAVRRRSDARRSWTTRTRARSAARSSAIPSRWRRRARCSTSSRRSSSSTRAQLLGDAIARPDARLAVALAADRRRPRARRDDRDRARPRPGIEGAGSGARRGRHRRGAAARSPAPQGRRVRQLHPRALPADDRPTPSSTTACAPGKTRSPPFSASASATRSATLPPCAQARSASSSRFSSPTSSARPRSRASAIRSACGRSSSASTTRCARRSSARAGPSRSSPATR